MSIAITSFVPSCLALSPKLELSSCSGFRWTLVIMVRFVHDFVCWLLSAVLLLTNGWPVAIQHAHDVGDNPYHHSHRPGASHVDLHEFASVGEAGEAVSSVTEHVHMLWFGWEVTIVPPKGCRPSPCPSAAAVGILSQLAEKDLGGCDAGVAQATNSPALAIGSTAPHGASQRSVNVRYRVAALPLCDTARHLRSGVQLI
jgi:hypothetical protein